MADTDKDELTVDEQNAGVLKQIEAHRAALIENGVDPDSWDGHSYAHANSSTAPKLENTENARQLDDFLASGTPSTPAPCEHIISKLEERSPDEDFNYLRFGADEAAYAGIEYGDAPATPEVQEQLKQAEVAEIHRLNHLSKETAQHVRRGGGRPSQKQKQRTLDAFQEDVRSEIMKSEPFEVMIERMANEIGAPMTEEEFAKLSPTEQFIFASDVKKAEKS